ncbi:uncharacterized protein N7484_000275 [Penicillium longicatenatum]|uniref:uncharacterized protein n=1 Tax=Penicillium longicatenatum TaxID=1561947 RepID=UPI002546E2F9|nr:uncharacterized protein N7484_000275 [Penicillium longicatenatum]KAJ5660903.1 hypothetical protein N7484_000275 [Penicillium longicatenatum]
MAFLRFMKHFFQNVYEFITRIRYTPKETPMNDLELGKVPNPAFQEFPAPVLSLNSFSKRSFDYNKIPLYPMPSHNNTLEVDELPLSEIEAIIADFLRTPLGSHDAAHELQDLEKSEKYNASLKIELLGLWKMKWDDRACENIIDNRDDSYELLQHEISNCDQCHQYIFGVPKEANMVTFCLALKEKGEKEREHLFFKKTFEELIPKCTWNAQWFQTCMEHMSYDNWYTCIKHMSYSNWCKAAIAVAYTENNADFLELMMQNIHPGMRQENEFKSALLIKIVETACWHSSRRVVLSFTRSLESQTPGTEETTTEGLDKPEEVTIQKVRALGDIRINSSVLHDLQLDTTNAGLYEVTRVLGNLSRI